MRILGSQLGAHHGLGCRGCDFFLIFFLAGGQIGAGLGGADEGKLPRSCPGLQSLTVGHRPQELPAEPPARAPHAANGQSAPGSNPGLPHCRWVLYQLSHEGSPRILECQRAQKADDIIPILTDEEIR